MAFDISMLLKLLQELLNQLFPAKTTASLIGKELKPAMECDKPTCCTESLKCHAKILDDAVFFHEQVHSDENSTQEAKDRAECLLHCAACAMQYAIKLHQEECNGSDMEAQSSSTESSPPSSEPSATSS